MPGAGGCSRELGSDRRGFGCVGAANPLGGRSRSLVVTWLICHKASAALVYLLLLSEVFLGVNGSCKALLSSLQGSASVTCVSEAQVQGQSNVRGMRASKGGEDAQGKAVFLLAVGFGHGGERRAAT